MKAILRVIATTKDKEMSKIEYFLSVFLKYSAIDSNLDPKRHAGSFEQF